MSGRSLALLLLWASPAVGQTAGIGVAPEPGGTLVGRVCLDLDGDRACADGEPGLAGARLRLEDGSAATADAEGRFHVLGLRARAVLPDRAAYGAHAVSVEGLGVRRTFELALRGAAQVDLPVAVGPSTGPGGTVSSRSSGAPRLEGDRLLWPLAGTAPAGARIRSASGEVLAGADGTWIVDVPLDDGPNRVGVAIESVEGGLELWALAIHVARPSSGPRRVYPAPPVLLATVAANPAGAGAVVLFGSVAGGTTLTVGERSLRPSPDGRFGAWARAEEGAVRVRASSGPLAAEATIPIAPARGSLEGLLLGELELQLGGRAGLLVSGRLAASGRARWRGFVAEGGVDLDDRDRAVAALAAPRDGAVARLVLDPQRTFASPGDQASQEDANPGRGRIWARVEGHGLSARLGGARTGLVAELGRHDRSFFGARVDGEVDLGPARLAARIVGGSVGADAGGAAPGVPAQDVLAATGGSLYYLHAGQVVAGSEIVRIEARDPLTGGVVARRELARGRDYELDPVGGRLLLARPLSSAVPLAAVVAGDPFAAAESWVVVDYLRLEPAQVGARRGVAGAEVRGRTGPLFLSLGGAAESRPGPDWSVLRAGAGVDLGALLVARVDVARSEGLAFGAEARRTSLDGGFGYGPPVGAGAPGGSLAFHAKAQGAAGPARWSGWWRERPAGYSDDEFQEPFAARDRGLLAGGDAGPVELRLAWVERRGVDPADPAGTARRDVGRAYASGTSRAGRLSFTAEALHEWQTLPARGEQSAAGLRAEWKGAHGLSLEASHLQAFGVGGDVVESTFSAAGAALRTREGTLAARAGWGPALGPRLVLSGERGDPREGLYGTLAVEPAPARWGEAAGSAVGGRQRVDGGALFTEERIARDPLGVVAGRTVGASLAPTPGLAVALSGERGERRRLDGRTVARGAVGLSAAWTRGQVRLDGRAERRTEGSGAQWLAGGGAEWSATPRLTFAARALLADGEIGGGRARGTDAWLSAAWRTDALSVLGRVGRLVDDRALVVERDATIYGLAAVVRPARRAQIALALDGARQLLAGARDDRVAGSVRGTFVVAGPVDVGLEYARRGSLDGREIGDLDAVRAEAGLSSGGVRLALGYTLTGFRGDGLAPEEDDGRLYLRAVVVR